MTAVGMRWHNITVPERQLTPVLTTPRKPFSQRFWDLLASESGAPMWPDAPQLADGPRNTGVEQIGKTLDYTIQTWKSGRCADLLPCHESPAVLSGIGTRLPHRCIGDSLQACIPLSIMRNDSLAGRLLKKTQYTAPSVLNHDSTRQSASE